MVPKEFAPLPKFFKASLGSEINCPNNLGRWKPSAFTLIELLVTIAIIALLASLLVVGLAKAKETARATKCLSNLHQMGVALEVWVSEHDQRMPVMYDNNTNANPPISETNLVGTVLGHELGSTNVLLCPSDVKGIFQGTGSSYAWNNLLNGQSAANLQMLGISSPGRIPVFFDKEAFHIARGAGKGINFLYADSHIKNRIEMEN